MNGALYTIDNDGNPHSDTFIDLGSQSSGGVTLRLGFEF